MVERAGTTNRIAYICPKTLGALRLGPDGLLRVDGTVYPFIPGMHGGAHPVPSFIEIATLSEWHRVSLSMYDLEAAQATYRNFLDWLFATFETDEVIWRAAMATRLRLRPGDAVLVTGCGLGDDIPAILDAVDAAGEVHAQDLSPEMIHEASARLARRDRHARVRSISRSATPSGFPSPIMPSMPPSISAGSTCSTTSAPVSARWTA